MPGMAAKFTPEQVTEALKHATPAQLAPVLNKREQLVTHTTAAQIMGVAAPNFRRDYGDKLTSILVAAGSTTKPMFFRSEVEALAKERAALAKEREHQHAAA